MYHSQSGEELKYLEDAIKYLYFWVEDLTEVEDALYSSIEETMVAWISENGAKRLPLMLKVVFCDIFKLNLEQSPNAKVLSMRLKERKVQCL